MTRMNKKGGFALDKLLIGIIVFGLFVTFGSLLITDINTNYNKTMDTSDFVDVYNTSGEMHTTTQNMKNLTLQGDISDTDSTETMIRGSYSAVRLVTGSFAITGGIIQEMALKLNVPPIFVTAAITALTLSIIFAFIFMFLLRLKN